MGQANLGTFQPIQLSCRFFRVFFILASVLFQKMSIISFLDIRKNYFLTPIQNPGLCLCTIRLFLTLLTDIQSPEFRTSKSMLTDSYRFCKNQDVILKTKCQKCKTILNRPISMIRSKFELALYVVFFSYQCLVLGPAMDISHKWQRPFSMT